MLILISFLGLFVKKKGFGIAFFALGITATALLMPALSIPDGIPSPASYIGNYAPWEHELKPTNRQAHQADFTHQLQPWLVYMRTEFREGRMPFWNPYQYSGYPFWSNGQSAPLFPLNLFFIILPLQFAFIIFPWLKIMIGGMGIWFLARELGIGQKGSLVASLIFPLSGIPIVWIFAPLSSAILLVPWVLWAVERIANEKGGWQELSFIAALQLLAGHPETVIHTAMISGIYLLIRGSTNFYRTWGFYIVGWVLAAALSAVFTIPMLYMIFESGKWLHELGNFEKPLFLPAELLAQGLRVVLPHFFGHPVSGTWWGVGTYAGAAVYAGSISIVLASAVLKDILKDRKLLALAVLFIFCTLTGYLLPGPYTLLDSLPLLEDVNHHRLRFGMALTLALLAGFGFERWLRVRPHGMFFGALVIIIFLILAWVALLVVIPQLGKEHVLAERGIVESQFIWTIWILVTVVLLLLSMFLKPRIKNSIWLLIPLILAIDLIVANGNINPGLPLGKFYPSTPAIEFLKNKRGRIAGTNNTFRPNAAMMYGLYDIRGDDAVKLDRYEQVYSNLSQEYDPVFFSPIKNWHSPWLEKLGVRWVIGPPNASPEVSEWKRVYNGDDASVFELEDALPIVRLHEVDGSASDQKSYLSIEERKPGYWRISWDTKHDQVLVVAETWDKGWRATLSTDPNDSFTPERIDDILIGINVGAGSGQLELKYIPQGLFKGLLISILGLIVLLVGTYYRLRKNSIKNMIS